AGRAMRREFRPDRGEVESERRAGMTVLQEIFDELRRYAGGPERPQDVPGQPLPEQRTRLTTDPTDRRQAVEQEFWDHCNPLNAPVTWYRTDVRVTHNPEGELSAAWVLRSSGIEALDEAALEAARSGSMDLRPPPGNVVGERQAIRSDWAFEMGDVATPIACMTPELTPVVNVSCVEDPVHDEVQCAFLGRGIVRTRVRLLSVVDADHRTPEERRAARRRDPAMPDP
ncbi:MAG TPA: TonB family protein, partial [Sandaracinaceae bacterium LLY-WYZ-13_1]|nr:TonB family protein [Sandaracinaceae bacterium LLY-WYZ-13_1]